MESNNLACFLFTELGKKVKKYLDGGHFVPDDVMISLINEEIESLSDKNWLLDGKYKNQFNLVYIVE